MVNWKHIAISTIAVATITVVSLLVHFTGKIDTLEASEMKWIGLSSECADLLKDAIGKLDDKSFERNKECLEQGRVLARRWSNIGSGYYNAQDGQCWVSYKDVTTKEVKYSPMADMGDA